MAAFAWLREQVALHGDVLPWGLLLAGFERGGLRVPLLSQQGIFKPAACSLPLSIRTSAESPYDDHFAGDRLAYRYRGEDHGIGTTSACGAPWSTMCRSSTSTQ